jgi:hypothetical protein
MPCSLVRRRSQERKVALAPYTIAVTTDPSRQFITCVKCEVTYHQECCMNPEDALDGEAEEFECPACRLFPETSK